MIVQLSTMRAVVLCLFFCGLGAAQDSGMPPPLGKLIDVGGYHVHLYCTGTGSPTVVVVGAFSFDWGLVQPEVAKVTQICTYDASGTGWSELAPAQGESGPHTPACDSRVEEIHRALQSAGVRGPYVLVGYSIGGLMTRLYTQHYPYEVAGMVLVDHAFLDVGSDATPSKRVAANSQDSPPVLISSAPIVIGMEDDENFAKLPQRDREMHRWAMANSPQRPTVESAAECLDEVERSTVGSQQPLGDRPLLVVRTGENVPAYERLQQKLMGLSRNSGMVLAGKSSHMVPIDQPDVVSASIVNTVEAVRSGRKVR